MRFKLFKKKSPDATPTSPTRDKPVDNPYISARRASNDRNQTLITAKMTWQFFTIFFGLVAVAAVGGLIHVGSQSKVVPLVVDVDSHGVARSRGMAQSVNHEKGIQAAVIDFIQDTRMITADSALQRAAIFRAYSKLAPDDPARPKTDDWFRGLRTDSCAPNRQQGSDPYQRAVKELVSVEFRSMLAQSANTYQIDWDEVTRDRQGILLATITCRALVTYYQADFETRDRASKAYQAQVKQDPLGLGNPLGVFIRDYSWSRLH